MGPSGGRQRKDDLGSLDCRELKLRILRDTGFFGAGATLLCVANGEADEAQRRCASRGL
jgi:hypothetical protein